MVVGLVAQSASVVIISYGIHLKTQSPRFEEYEKSVRDRMVAKNQGKDNGPGLGVGMVLASAWEFVGCVMLFFTWFCILALLVLHAIALYSRVLARWATGVFCLWFAFANLRSGWHSLEWGFVTLGVGGVLTAIGLLLTVIGAPYVVLQTEEAQPRPTGSPVV